MEKHNLIIKGIEKSWNDEDLNRYIDELMQEIRLDERERFAVWYQLEYYLNKHDN